MDPTSDPAEPVTESDMSKPGVKYEGFERRMVGWSATGILGCILIFHTEAEYG